MQEPIGYLSYRLYCVGWRNGLHRRFSWLQHGVFSIFLYYRRGFADGSQWIKEYRLEGNLHR
jgi:hypothetical protein